MPYIDRDISGNIIAQYYSQQRENQEWIDIVPLTKDQIDSPILSQISSLEEQFTTTLQMRAFRGDADAISTVDSLLTQIETLKSQL